jgi:hypothetical protein
MFSCGQEGQHPISTSFPHPSHGTVFRFTHSA